MKRFNNYTTGTAEFDFVNNTSNKNNLLQNFWETLVKFHNVEVSTIRHAKLQNEINCHKKLTVDQN